MKSHFSLFGLWKMWYTLKKVVFGGSTFLALAGSTPPLLAAYHAAAIVLPSTAFASFDRWFYAVYQRMVMFFQLDLSRTQVTALSASLSLSVSYRSIFQSSDHVLRV